jgi:hypothetical protein
MHSAGKAGIPYRTFPKTRAPKLRFAENTRCSGERPSENMRCTSIRRGIGCYSAETARRAQPLITRNTRRSDRARASGHDDPARDLGSGSMKGSAHRSRRARRVFSEEAKTSIAERRSEVRRRLRDETSSTRIFRRRWTRIFGRCVRCPVGLFRPGPCERPSRRRNSTEPMPIVVKIGLSLRRHSFVVGRLLISTYQRGERSPRNPGFPKLRNLYFLVRLRSS